MGNNYSWIINCHPLLWTRLFFIFQMITILFIKLQIVTMFKLELFEKIWATSFHFNNWWWKNILGVICYQQITRRSKRQVFACFWNEIHLLLKLCQHLITIDTWGLPFQMGKLLFFNWIYFYIFQGLYHSKTLYLSQAQQQPR
jgi:hypothetical protein